MAVKKVNLIYEIELTDERTPRRCSICLEPATLIAMKRVDGGRVDRSSARPVCDDHSIFVMIWPPIKRPKLVSLPVPFAGMTKDVDLYNDYRHIMKEVGGTMPEPVRDEPVKKRKKCWTPLEPLSIRPWAPRTRGRRPAGMSGRQWTKFRKANDISPLGEVAGVLGCLLEGWSWRNMRRRPHSNHRRRGVRRSRPRPDSRVPVPTST